MTCIKTTLSISIMAVLLNACATTPPELTEFEPLVRPVSKVKLNYENGSLFQGQALALYEDIRPHQIGDVLTIVLQESTSATKAATTSTKKEDSVDFGAPTIFGKTPTYNGTAVLGLNLAPKRDFAGEADSTQSNTLSGEITVTVVDVLPNRNLVVQGEKWFTLNQGKEYIRIAGVVRPLDIDSENKVISTKLADAQITYSGEGMLADSNTQGWFTRFLNSQWWPF